MRPYQSNQEDEDPDIKKIKKVGHCGFLALEEHHEQLVVCSVTESATWSLK